MPPDSNATPDVSVVIPMYNAETTIAECVRSAIASGDSASAGGARVEVIVSDDGSTDQGPEIVERLAASEARVRLLQSPNTGPSAARNRGIDAARGRFVRFLDADDLATSGSSALLISAAHRTGAACGVFELMDSDGRSMHRYCPPHAGDCGVIGINELRHANCFGTGTMVIRRELLDGVRFDDRMRHCEDWACWAALARRGVRWRTLHPGAAPVQRYRICSGGLSQRPGDMLAGALRVLDDQALRDNAAVPAWAIAAQATTFATMLAMSGDGSAACEAAHRLLSEHIDREHRYTPQELGDSTIWAVLSTTDQHPEDFQVDARWQMQAASWWRLLCDAGRFTRGDLHHALSHLAHCLISPQAIAAELVERTRDSQRPIVVFGYAQHGRLIVEEARRNQRAAEIRDDALAADAGLARQCGVSHLSIRPCALPVEPEAIPVVSIEQHNELLEREDLSRTRENGLTWSQARNRLAASALASLEPLRRKLVP